ncbi:MAG: hypothetical protein ACKVVP_21080 [Chloroflexota bacterium]
MVQARTSVDDGAIASSDARDFSSRSRLGLGVLALILVVSLVIGWLTPGYEGDINQNKSWARVLVRNGMHEAYRGSIDYGPLPLYVFAAVGGIYQWTMDPAWSESAARASREFTFMMKVPMILAHVAIAGLLLSTARDPRLGTLVALSYGLNPATLYDIAHFGQSDTLVGLAALICLLGARSGLGGFAGVGGALLLISKPQGWILLPIAFCALLWHRSRRQMLIAGVSGMITLLAFLGPWVLNGRAHHVWRYLENLQTHALSNRVISADAHNLWWIPTLVNGDWVEDSAFVLGPLTYRMLATGLALGWLGFCLWSYRYRQHEQLFLVAAAVSFGFFMLMVRAHENHGYLALPLLAGALAVCPSRPLARVLVLASIALLMNLMLRDPFLAGPYSSIPDAGQEAPFAIVALQVANVMLNAATLIMFARILLERRPLRLRRA